MDGSPDRNSEEQDQEAGEAPARSPFDTPPPPPIPETLRERPGDARQSSKPAKSDSGGLSDMSKAWGVAMDFVFTIIGAALLGYFADRWQNTSPRYTMIGLAAGFTLALVRIIRRTMADEKRDRERRK